MARLAARYEVRIVFWRVVIAHARWPAPRAHNDLTHTPEISAPRDRQFLEQLARDLALPCVSVRCRVWICIEAPRFCSVARARAREGLERSPSFGCDPSTAAGKRSLSQVTEGAI